MVKQHLQETLCKKSIHTEFLAAKNNFVNFVGEITCDFRI